ncbi:MAG: 2,3-bisphosphoglycerate-independent phosphoglycerate mutase, partial [Actinomycetota bacterium]
MSGPLVLVVIDGFGVAPPGPGNAVTLARTPALDALAAEGSATLLQASGLPVGLPDGQMGNSEVGHLNLGAGRRVPQMLVRIDEAVAAPGGLAQVPAIA